MKVAKNLQVRAKVDRRWLNISFSLCRCRIMVNRKRSSRPVFYLSDIKANLPFKVDIGDGVQIRPKLILKIYYPAKTTKERIRVIEASKKKDVLAP